jgi:electron transfer flavoprotein alpha subunit
MTEQQCSILVYSEDERLVQELLSKARRSGEGKVGLVLLGDDFNDQAEYGRWGADIVYAVSHQALQHFNPETYTDALAGVVEQAQPDLVLVGGTKQGLEMSARVAERLDVGCASWCVDFEIDPASKAVTATCMIYSGVGLITYRVTSHPAMATVATGVFEAETFPGHDAQVLTMDVEISEPVMQVLEEKGKMAAGERLEDAPVIVDIGQGFEKQEDIALAERLAAQLEGQVSCTRPLSSERDWFPEWIGLSGAQLSPELCFTIGVSGAIQHMIGIRDSKRIVAINHDEHAGIHLQADYCVVEDLYQFVPILIDVLKARSINLAS